ncbi:glycerophosphoryl diester phosphodiesterase membrane domain-containing protein [Geminicoccus flavidas]|uniref:glycerophosphoryl diester phosphodiesterase membrane domain-containing protein n=1 Tax=Geminicoccus flavidas TaxID=2506407 RepID=UPI00135A1994|nr:glycerophosphoryl diester phosphodiesterase membrane domain-containing protein [Geminicoccus flavidas]
MATAKAPDRLYPFRIIRQGLQIVLTRPLQLFGLAGIAVFVATGLDMLAARLIASSDLANILGFVIQASGSAMAAVAVTRVVLAQADGRELGVAEAYRAAGPAALRVFGASLLVSIGVLIGFVLFVVPGLWLATLWIVAVPAAIVEDLPPLSAVRRSSQLTRGNRWPALVLVILSVAVGTGLGLLLALLISIPVGWFAGPEAVETATGYTHFGQVLESVGVAVQVVLSSTFAALTWHRLREIWRGAGHRAAASAA